MIIQTEYRWEIAKDGDAYTATLIAGKPFVFRFTRGITPSTPPIGCRVTVFNEAWTGECTDNPETMPEMDADDVAKLYARIARDAGDAFIESIKTLAYIHGQEP